MIFSGRKTTFEFQLVQWQWALGTSEKQSILDYGSIICYKQYWISWLNLVLNSTFLRYLIFTRDLDAKTYCFHDSSTHLNKRLPSHCHSLHKKLPPTSTQCRVIIYEYGGPWFLEINIPSRWTFLKGTIAASVDRHSLTKYLFLHIAVMFWFICRHTYAHQVHPSCWLSYKHLSCFLGK